MRSPLLLLSAGLAAVVLSSCSTQNRQPASSSGDHASAVLTVVRRSTDAASAHTAVDTLFRRARIDPHARVDLYFLRDSLHLGVKLPSGGFLRNAGQDKECNWDLYPAMVRCCTYDSLDRVASMTIDGSGMREEWKYRYDAQGRVVECKGWWSVYSLAYDGEGRITRLTAQRSDDVRTYELSYAAL